MKKTTIALFDFDGTITRNDSFLIFLRYTHPTSFFSKMFMLCPTIFLYKVGVIKNERAKQLIFSSFFKGWSIDKFNASCAKFVEKLNHNIRPAAITEIEKCIAQNIQIMIISASFENYVQLWADQYNIAVAGTIVELDNNDNITGRFASKNCYGQEKVDRLLALIPELKTNRNQYHITAYGDSQGDTQMLNFADKSHFKPFKC